MEANKERNLNRKAKTRATDENIKIKFVDEEDIVICLQHIAMVSDVHGVVWTLFLVKVGTSFSIK